MAEPAPTWSLDRGDRVLITGAAGFIGSALTRELCGRDVHVVALVEPGGDRSSLDGLDVEEVTADLRDAAALGRLMARAARQPDADADRAHLGHPLRQETNAVIEDVADNRCVRQRVKPAAGNVRS